MPLLVSDWSEEDVLVWLREDETLAVLVDKFRANNIDGTELLQLTKETLESELRIGERNTCTDTPRPLRDNTAAAKGRTSSHRHAFNNTSQPKWSQSLSIFSNMQMRRHFILSVLRPCDEVVVCSWSL